MLLVHLCLISMNNHTVWNSSQSFLRICLSQGPSPARKGLTLRRDKSHQNSSSDRLSPEKARRADPNWRINATELYQKLCRNTVLLWVLIESVVGVKFLSSGVLKHVQFLQTLNKMNIWLSSHIYYNCSEWKYIRCCDDFHSTYCPSGNLLKITSLYSPFYGLTT